MPPTENQLEILILETLVLFVGIEPIPAHSKTASRSQLFS